MNLSMWIRLPTRIEEAVGAELDSWLDTPYMLGQSCKKRGVDCVNLLSSVLDNLRGRPMPESIRKLQGDTCLHNSEAGFAALRAIIEAHQPVAMLPRSFDTGIQPGDVVIVGPIGGGPGHGLIAGVRPSTFLHATHEGVVYGGRPTLAGQQLIAVYRFMRKLEEWCSPKSCTLKSAPSF